MNNSRLRSVICVFAFVIFSLPASAATFNVLGGNFELVDPQQGNPPAIASLTGNGFLEEGLFDGSAAAVATDSSATFAGFFPDLFLGQTLLLYYAATGTDSLMHPAPTIDFNTMTADLSSLYANWNLNEFNIGGLATVIQTGANMWELSVTQTQPSGPFLGFTTIVNMQISQVPVPAAIWLFDSGLLGMIGVSRLQQSA